MPRKNSISQSVCQFFLESKRQNENPAQHLATLVFKYFCSGKFLKKLYSHILLRLYVPTAKLTFYIFSLYYFSSQKFSCSAQQEQRNIYIKKEKYKMTSVDFSNGTYTILSQPQDWDHWVVQLERLARFKGVWQYITIAPIETREPYPEEPEVPDFLSWPLETSHDVNAAAVALDIFWVRRRLWREVQRPLEDVFTFMMNTISREVKWLIAPGMDLAEILDRVMELCENFESFDPMVPKE